VSLVCARLTRGTITAIDRSALQVRRARDRNRACIASGRAVIEQATLEDFEPERRFTKIFAVNVNAFWTTPARSIPSLARLLASRGSVYLVYEPPSEARLREVRSLLLGALESHGLTVIDDRVQAFRSSLGLCLVVGSST
jgi:hypothetical protein